MKNLERMKAEPTTFLRKLSKYYDSVIVNEADGMDLTDDQIVSMMNGVADSFVPTEEQQAAIMTQVQAELRAGQLEIKRHQVERHLLFASHFRLSRNEIQKITSDVIEAYAYLIDTNSHEPINSRFLHAEASERMNQALEQKQTKDPIPVEASLPVTTSLSDLSLRKVLFNALLDLTELEQLLIYFVLGADKLQSISSLAVLLETPATTLASEVLAAANVLCIAVFNDVCTRENEPVLISLLNEMFKSRLPPTGDLTLNKGENGEVLHANAMDFLNAVKLTNERRRSQINVRKIIKRKPLDIERRDVVFLQNYEFPESSLLALLWEI
jgi:hypothetical protein